MTTQQQLRLSYSEQTMRGAATGITAIAFKMKEINQFSARNALKGVIEYLTDKLNEIPATITIGELEAKGEIAG